MQARRLPAIRGWNWIVEGFRLFRSNPALLTFLVFGYWLTLIFLNLVPLIGVVLAPLCVPALSVGVMNGCRALERDQARTASACSSPASRRTATCCSSWAPPIWPAPWRCSPRAPWSTAARCWADHDGQPAAARGPARGATG
jgi:hypothetical protein